MCANISSVAANTHIPEKKLRPYLKAHGNTVSHTWKLWSIRIMKSQITAAKSKTDEKEFTASLIVQILWVEMMQRAQKGTAILFIASVERTLMFRLMPSTFFRSSVRYLVFYRMHRVTAFGTDRKCVFAVWFFTRRARIVSSSESRTTAKGNLKRKNFLFWVKRSAWFINDSKGIYLRDFSVKKMTKQQEGTRQNPRKH